MKIIRLKSIDSTNKEAFRLLNHFQRVAILSETQTEGYGRNGAKWHSFKGNIHLSVGAICKIACLDTLSIRVLYHVFSMLKKEVKGQLLVKWPNDILLNGEKAGGILIESKVKGDNAMVVVGIGLNYEKKPLNDSACLKDALTMSREEVENMLMEEILNAIDSRLSMKTLFEFFLENSYLQKGDEVTLNRGDRILKGRFVGFTEKFGIRIDIDGNTRTFYSGEVKKIRKS